jgi:hypothetical protein
LWKHVMWMVYKTTGKHTKDPTHTTCDAGICAKNMSFLW